jgi:poly-gamma-glutamate synthesis protein (capsule biosynthesis protein)
VGAAALLSYAVLSVKPPHGVPPTARQLPARELRVRLLAVGDINLGREVGQEILGGDTLYPFHAVQDTFARFDLVFGNLESCLSDEGGETQSSKNNLVFTGPPAGARSLRRAGVHVVSTANNHALDYGLKGWAETIDRLQEAGVGFVGTGRDSLHLAGPLVLDRGGVRIAIFACTDVMNRPGSGWRKYVAAADTGTVAGSIRTFRDSVDFVIVSYHGGEEYAQRPTRRTVEFARAMIDAGADLFLGHHPHVPYGIERRGKGLIVYSLGNFVFRQRDREWTKRSYAFSAEILKDTIATRMCNYQIIPVRCGLQPAFVVERSAAAAIHERVRQLSSVEVSEQMR